MCASFILPFWFNIIPTCWATNWIKRVSTKTDFISIFLKNSRSQIHFLFPLQRHFLSSASPKHLSLVRSWHPIHFLSLSLFSLNFAIPLTPHHVPIVRINQNLFTLWQGCLFDKGVCHCLICLLSCCCLGESGVSTAWEALGGLSPGCVVGWASALNEANCTSWTWKWRLSSSSTSESENWELET